MQLRIPGRETRRILKEGIRYSLNTTEVIDTKHLMWIKFLIRKESADVVIVIESLERKKTCLSSLQDFSPLQMHP
jgi:hypothetical protein